MLPTPWVGYVRSPRPSGAIDAGVDPAPPSQPGHGGCCRRSTTAVHPHGMTSGTCTLTTVEPRREPPMTATTHPRPVPFTRDDYAIRMARVTEDAREAGLDGVIVTPGPDLVWLTGYRPTAITERLTMLVLTPGERPTLLVPVLERPDAEAAEGAPSLDDHRLVRRLGSLPGRPRPAASRTGRFGVSGLGLGDAPARAAAACCQRTSYQALTQSMPMLRAVKDAQRAGAAGHGRRGRRRDVPGDHPRAVRGPTRDRGRGRSGPAASASSATSRSTSPWSDPGPTAPTRTTRPVTG